MTRNGHRTALSFAAGQLPHQHPGLGGRSMVKWASCTRAGRDQRLVRGGCSTWITGPTRQC